MLSILGTTSENTIISEVLSLSFDTIIILALITFFSFYAFFRGKGRSFATLIALYMVGFIAAFFPYTDVVGEYIQDPMYAQMVMFITFFIVARIGLSQIIYGDYSDGVVMQLFHILLLGIFNTALILFYAHQIISLEGVYTFSPALHELFSSELYFFWILIIVPISAYFIARERTF